MAKRVFVSYAEADEPLRAELEKQLAPLQRTGAAVVWDDRQALAGDTWQQTIEGQIDAADVILLLLTPDFLSSDKLQDEQVNRALARSETAGARVVPILVRECSWEIGVLAKLEPLPGNREAVTSWSNRDKAWKEVVAGVVAVLGEGPTSARRGASATGSRVTGVFVGRGRELSILRASLLPDEGVPRPVAVCALHGMAGVGKSYLADRFANEQVARFPGGLVRLVLRPGEQEQAPSDDALLAEIARQLDLRGPPDAKQVALRLRSPRTLLHIENADGAATATSAARLATQLPGCAVIVTGRYRDLGRAIGFVPVDVSLFTEAQSLELLALEIERPIAPAERDAFARLAAALGHLPLALSLAAGYLREGYGPEAFLELLRAEGLQVAPLDPAHPALLADQARAIVGRAFDLSLDLLRAALAKEADRLLDGFFALGHAPVGGFGPSLGATIAGLAEGDFLRLASLASRHSLLDRVAGERARWTVHPLLAEMGRTRANGEAALARMTEWFVERLDPAIDENGVVQGPRWHEVRDETAALVSWLPMVRDADLARVARAGSRFALRHGPFAVWQRFCERALTCCQEPRDRSNVLFTLGDVARSAGDLNRALSAAEEKAALDRSQDWPAEAAMAMGQIADILAARGQLDEALRIRREEELPVYEQLGDVRSRAITQGKIADILAARGQLDEALRIRREESLPVYEQLGDVRSRAITQGRIADILAARGQLDEALRIRREESLPVYEQLGDVRSLLVGRAKLAMVLCRRNAPGDRDEARELLRLAWGAAMAMRIPEAAIIREYQVAFGFESA